MLRLSRTWPRSRSALLTTFIFLAAEACGGETATGANGAGTGSTNSVGGGGTSSASGGGTHAAGNGTHEIAGTNAAGSDAVASAAPASVVEFCPAFNEAHARYYSRCVGGPVEGWKNYYSVTTCGVIARSVAAGRVVYDAQKAVKCLAEMEQQPCDSHRLLPESGACEATLAGQLAPGQTCRALDPDYAQDAFPTECVPGSRCQSQGIAWEGVCTPYAKLGGACGGLWVPPLCANGLSCELGQCMANVGEGTACEGDALWGNCSAGLYCEGGLDVKANTATTGAGTCRKQLASGACTVGTTACTMGYNCPGRQGEASSCARTKVEGEACTPGQHECFGHCGPNGTCSLWGVEGEVCGIPGTDAGLVELVWCGHGLFCAPTSSTSTLNGVCRHQLQPGAPCTGAATTADIRSACAATDTALGYCDTTTGLCALK